MNVTPTDMLLGDWPQRSGLARNLPAQSGPAFIDDPPVTSEFRALTTLVIIFITQFKSTHKLDELSGN